MRYILDTNTLSFALKGDASVLQRMVSVPRTHVLLPQPVVAEIEYELARLPASKRRERLARRFQLILREIQRIGWTDGVSRAFGDTKADLERRGLPIQDFDIAIAAHALSIEGTLVTDNLEHMSRISSLKVQNWRLRPSV